MNTAEARDHRRQAGDGRLHVRSGLNSLEVDDALAPAGQRLDTLGTTERYLSPQEIARGPSRLPPLLGAGGK